jgi:hypothetical protein
MSNAQSPYYRYTGDPLPNRKGLTATDAVGVIVRLRTLQPVKVRLEKSKVEEPLR